VNVSVWDPTKICGIVITFVDLAPEPSPELEEGFWADEAATLKGSSPR
jgi:hypothetical protein